MNLLNDPFLTELSIVMRVVAIILLLVILGAQVIEYRRIRRIRLPEAEGLGWTPALLIVACILNIFLDGGTAALQYFRLVDSFRNLGVLAVLNSLPMLLISIIGIIFYFGPKK